VGYVTVSDKALILQANLTTATLLGVPRNKLIGKRLSGFIFMLRAGASGYITKDCEPDVLLAAVRKVAVHGNYMDPGIAKKMAFDALTTSPRPPHALLSDRELQVFRLLTTGQGVNAIAAQLAISNKTVSTHKARLLAKLKLTSMAELMRYAMPHDLLG